MEKAKDKIALLIKQGKEFTYQNFSTKEQHGYTSAYSPEWVAWRARVESAVTSLLEEGSAAVDILKTGLSVKLIGFGPDRFDLAQSYFLGALQAAYAVLEEDTFNELQISAVAGAPGNFSNEVFIVHGHDEKAKNELEIFLSEIGLKPIVLHRKADEGQTIIEKFEKHSQVGFAFILLTPDEIAYLKSDDALPDEKRSKEWRTRPNVIFEFGFFVGKLGRSRVCCLYTGDVTLPSDITGMLYKKYNNSIDEVSYGIIKELKAKGYKLK
jgi:predicted nucleotide-binding protein